MAPINKKRSFPSANSEIKKWKEQKLLNGDGLRAEGSTRPDQEHPNGVIAACGDLVNGQIFMNSGTVPTVTNGASYTVTSGITHTISNRTTHTISIAVPRSILDNAQSQELRTYLVGQIARAACIYRVNEIVVYEDLGSESNNAICESKDTSSASFCRLLQYLECPQYLRKYLFPLHKDLQYAGILNPLDAPHHLRQSDDFPFREGVVSHHLLKQGKGSYVNVGLLRDVCVDKTLVPDVRVTVRLLPQRDGSKKRFGVIVPPAQPREELGIYWGYSVRMAASLSDVFSKSPYKEGYDLTIGTSDKGKSIENCHVSEFSNFKHILIVFGGLDGLEAALECDESLTIGDVKLLFDKYLNTCPGQGSRTIRTEEAVLITLAQITSRINEVNFNSDSESASANEIEL